MTLATAAVQVTSFHSGSFGGGALLGWDVTCETDSLVRVLVPVNVLPREPVAGEVWRVTGSIEMRSVFDPKHRRTMDTEHLIAAWAAPVAPSGAAIRQWIAKHPAIKGVGHGYAERLWDAFGRSLYDILRERNVDAISKVLDYPKAAAIVDAFGLLVDEISALEDLDDFGLDGRTARAAITLFGLDAGRRFRENPYLLTLLEPWDKIDTAALSIGVQPSDERRLLAAVDVAAARAWRTSGDTVMKRGAMAPHVASLLGHLCSEMATGAIDLAIACGGLKQLADDHLQARAPWHMERQIEASVAQRLARSRTAVDRALIDVVIAEVEREDGITFEPEQRAAVHMALSSGVGAIAGGAGTGKSTIVKAIMRAARRAKRGDYVQIALSGRAAKRLRDATGESALTIYRYLKDMEHGRLKMPHGLLVIDECSMVSTPDLWLILTTTPAEVDVLLVGDPGQLPPIQAGNPLAAIMSSKNVPKVTLRAPHRQKASTGIPRASEQVRHGEMPNLPVFDPRQADKAGVFLVPCNNEDVGARALDVFAAMASSVAGQSEERVALLHEADVQILSATKMLAKEIGAAIEARWLANQPPIHNWGFHVGSKFLWTKNSYEHADERSGRVSDIMNGALGVFQKATPNGAEVLFDDGTRTEIYIANLDRILRGWAITIHKAQGSAFRSVIIPVSNSRLLDRAMLYTAITRARHSVVLVGDPTIIKRAVTAPPKIWERLQGLDLDHVS